MPMSVATIPQSSWASSSLAQELLNPGSVRNSIDVRQSFDVGGSHLPSPRRAGRLASGGSPASYVSSVAGSFTLMTNHAYNDPNPNPRRAWNNMDSIGETGDAPINNQEWRLLTAESGSSMSGTAHLRSRGACADNRNCLNFWCTARHPFGRQFLEQYEAVLRPANLKPLAAPWQVLEIQMVLVRSGQDLQGMLARQQKWNRPLVESVEALCSKLEETCAEARNWKDMLVSPMEPNMADMPGSAQLRYNMFKVNFVPLLGDITLRARKVAEVVCREVYAAEASKSIGKVPLRELNQLIEALMSDEFDQRTKLVGIPAHVISQFSKRYFDDSTTNSGMPLDELVWFKTDGNNSIIAARYAVRICHCYNQWVPLFQRSRGTTSVMV